jgi:hypothetical protein
MTNPILQHFRFSHLPAHLQCVSQPFHAIAASMDAALPDCAEKSAGLRKLLEAKDCFVRAAVERTETETEHQP